MNEPKIRRIVLVDDHSLFRSGLRGLLERRGGYRVVGEAGSGEEFLEHLAEWQPDVVFMDFSLPGIDGAATTERALQQQSELRIITLSMFGDESYYSRMVEAGARGFLMKDTPFEELLTALETVYDGGTYFCEELLQILSERMRSANEAAAQTERLSAREVEILLCVCRGLSNQEIADELFISKRTVDKHRANILEKTGCRNTAALVAYAFRRHIVAIDG